MDMQVANHMLGARISKQAGNDDIAVIMDDSGDDSPHHGNSGSSGSGSDTFDADTSRRRLLEGNQASDSSDLMAAELEAVKAGRSPAFRSSMRQSVQADSTMRLGPAAFSAKQADKQQAVEMADFPLKPESRTTSSPGLGVTPSSSHQDLSQMQQRQSHTGSPQHPARHSSRLMPSNGSFDDFGDERRSQQIGSSHTPSPLAAPQASPFMYSSQQDRLVPDPAAPADSPPEGSHPLDRSHSFHSGRITRWWGRFDAQYMQPVFGGPSPGGAVSAIGGPGRPQPVIDPNAPTEQQPRT